MAKIKGMTKKNKVLVKDVFKRDLIIQIKIYIYISVKETKHRLTEELKRERTKRK